MINYYSVLGVRDDASDGEIRIGYKRMANFYHPDKGGNSEQFKKIQEAYEVLTDPNKRNYYDCMRQVITQKTNEVCFDINQVSGKIKLAMGVAQIKKVN